MNYGELKQYLVNTGDNEFVDLIDRANTVLEKYEVEDYILNMENILTNPNFTDQDTKDSIRATIEGLINHILNLHTLVLNENVLFSDKIEITNGLYEMSFYEDKDIILNICDKDTPSTERLSEILSLVTPFQTEYLMSLIQEIDDSIFDMIKRDFIVEQEDESIDIDSIKNKVTMYAKFKESIGNIYIYSDIYFQNPNSINMPFDLYLSAYLNEQNVDSLDIEIIAKVLLGLSILSDNNSLILDTIRKSLSRVTTDMSRSVQIDKTISILLGKIGTS